LILLGELVELAFLYEVQVAAILFWLKADHTVDIRGEPDVQSTPRQRIQAECVDTISISSATDAVCTLPS
jgi:hypothetical protein